MGINVRIDQISEESKRIRLFRLVPVNGEPLPPFAAGAHIDVHLDTGLIRQYSLCNRPGCTEFYEIAVLQETQSRGGSVAMHQLAVGQTLLIGSPRNSFALDESAVFSILIGGGIGVTPLWSMAHRLRQIGLDFSLHYCVRSRSEAAFMSQIGSVSFRDKIVVYADDDPAGGKLDLESLLRGKHSGTHLYLCGPPGFMSYVLQGAQDSALESNNVHTEHFKAPPILDRSADENFEIEIRSTGRVFVVPPDKTVLDVLHQEGLEVPMSCEQGICGTCRVGVLQGEPDHRDSFLTAQERADNRSFLPCSSRARSSRLVLDL